MRDPRLDLIAWLLIGIFGAVNCVPDAQAEPCPPGDEECALAEGAVLYEAALSSCEAGRERAETERDACRARVAALESDAPDVRPIAIAGVVGFLVGLIVGLLR